MKAALYDRLQQSADASDGIGAGRFFDRDSVPCCLLGHLAVTKLDPVLDLTAPMLLVSVPMAHELKMGRGSVHTLSDMIVEQINLARDRDPCDRVPFADYAAAAGWVRDA